MFYCHLLIYQLHAYVCVCVCVCVCAYVCVCVCLSHRFFCWHIIIQRFNSYYLKYSDYCLHLYCYIHNDSPELPFVLLQVYYVKRGSVHGTSTRTLYLIHGQEVNCSYTVNHNQAQVLSYSKYSLLFINTQMISPRSSLNKRLYLLSHVSCWTTPEGRTIHPPKSCIYNNKDERR